MRFVDPPCQDALARLSHNEDYLLVLRALREWKDEQIRQLIYSNETDRVMILTGMARAVDMAITQLTFTPR